jgi:hypothetical protein
MATLYYIRAGGVSTELASAGGHSLVVDRKTRAVSTASWACDVAADSAPLWPYGTAAEVVRVVDGGSHEVMLAGTVIVAEPDAEAAAERILYVLADAWHWLEREPYRQTRKIVNSAGTLVDAVYGRAILCQADNGTRLSAAATVSAVASFAASIGIDIAAGTCSAPVLPPWDEITDKMLAEIILRVLRWQPDALPWIDHTQDPPLLHVTRLADMTAVDIAFTDLTVCRVRPFNELQIPGCVVTFELSNEHGRTVSEQTAGNASALGCARMTIPLEHEAGSPGPVQEVKVVAMGDYETVSWWQKLFPWLPSDADLSEFQILPTPAEGFNKILVAGVIQQWMTDEYEVEAGSYTVSCKAGFTLEGRVYSEKELSRSFTLTNAETKRYKGRPQLGWIEPEPAGLASAFYAAASVLQYGGVLVAEEAECSIGRSLLGKKVNVTGGLAAWASMGAAVTGVREDIDKGVTTVTLGPVSPLSPRDMIDLVRGSRLLSKFTPLDRFDGGVPAEDATEIDPFAPEDRGSDSPGVLEALTITLEET